MNLLRESAHLAFVSARARTDNTARVDNLTPSPVNVVRSPSTPLTFSTITTYTTSGAVPTPRTNPPILFANTLTGGQQLYTTTSTGPSATYRIAWTPTSPRFAKTNSQEKATQK